MDRLTHLTVSLAIGLGLTSPACKGAGSLEVEPCMPLSLLMADVPTLETGDFVIERRGELRTEEMAWKRLTVRDGAKTLFVVEDVKAWVSVYKERVTVVCTNLLPGGPISVLPEVIGPLRGAFISNGFALERTTRGDFLSTSPDELLRQQNYVRDDYSARIGVDVSVSSGTFMYDICIASVRKCRSPALLEFQKRDEHVTEEFAPRVLPLPAQPEPAH